MIVLCCPSCDDGTLREATGEERRRLAPLLRGAGIETTGQLVAVCACGWVGALPYESALEPRTVQPLLGVAPDSARALIAALLDEEAAHAARVEALWLRLPAALRRARAQQRDNQAQIAERTGIDRAIVGKIETGDRRVGVGVLERLAQGYSS